MIRLDLVVENRLGLHARAAAKLVRVASRFRSEVHLAKDGFHQTIDCKSILGVLMLAARQGTHLVVSLDGPDELEAAEAISRLFAVRFGEEN